MKRLLLIFAIALTATFQTRAGGYKVYYIAHNSLDRISTLVEELISYYNNASESEWQAIFYLANRQKPVIATTNDGRDSFNELISMLQRSSNLELDFDYDNDALLSLFEKHPFTDKEGNFLNEYGYIDVTFFINSDFWNMGGNENLIGSLFYALDCDNEKHFKFSILSREEDPIIISDTKRPLGPKVSGDFLSKIDIITY